MTLQQPSVKRVLVLDGTPEVGSTITTIARRSGLDCRVVDSSDRFFADIVAWDPTHLVVDLWLPPTEGVELLRRLGETGCVLPVLVVNGGDAAAQHAVERVAVEAGLDLFTVLAKPFAFSAWEAFFTVEPAERHPFVSEDAGPTGACAPGREALEAGLVEGQFFLAYQPKVSCTHGGLAGFEALLRWQHPERGELSAQDFIGEADRLDLLRPITDFVLQEGIAWAAQAGRTARFSLAVNVSPVSLADADFVDRLLQFCDARDFPTERLVLELPESAATGRGGVLESLVQLRRHGVRLSLDNFGGGGTSVRDLARLPLQELKIERGFVIAAAHSDEARRTVLAIIAMAKALGLATVAEGVETLDAFRFLNEAGCDFAQGFFIGRPMQGAHARAWMGTAA